ncbi:hypothetical protein C8Q75DRAFT_758138, partial [Abortiporus biennis]
TVIEVLLISSLSFTSVTLLPSRSSSSSPPFSPDNSTDTSRNALAANAGCCSSLYSYTHTRSGSDLDTDLPTRGLFF